jgi:DHA2 family multidrug resistance protein
MSTDITNSPSKKVHQKEASPLASQVTSRPIVAIIGVLLGALVSIFSGRLLSIGSPDVQGAIGASSDYMSWLNTSFNAGSMFMGPLSVFLAGMYGPRRVLLWASVVFMLAEFLSPLLAHDFRMLIILQFLAGLSSGAYYPLTTTSIIKHLPLRLLHLGIAAYSLDILASTHVTNLIEAWYINNLSWHWIFWNALLVAPVLMVCIALGMPQQPMPEKSPRTNLRGFLYASASLTLIFCALDQGERLDWFNSGVVNGLLAAGTLLALVTIIRHLRAPHPLVNMRFLATRNFLLLGIVMTCFRFLLLAPTLLVPQFLEVLHRYRPDQTGQVLAWTAILELIAAPLAGYLVYTIDSRLVCGLGFAIVGFSCFASSQIDPGWTGETFVLAQALNSIGLAFAIAGMIFTILRNGLDMGALKSPMNMYTLSAWMHICRLFGAECGKSLMLRFLHVQGNFHYTVLAQELNGGWQTDERIRLLISGLFPGGSGLDDAKLSAIGTFAQTLKQQVTMLAISDGFVLIALAAVFCLVILGCMTYATPLVSRQSKAASG